MHSDDFTTENFKANLKLATSYYPSVSEVCRKLGINRQQFMKETYWSGFLVSSVVSKWQRECSLLFKREQAPPHPVSNGQNRPLCIAQETDNAPKLKLSLWRSSSLVEARSVTEASR